MCRRGQLAPRGHPAALLNALQICASASSLIPGATSLLMRLSRRSSVCRNWGNTATSLCAQRGAGAEGPAPSSVDVTIVLLCGVAMARRTRAEAVDSGGLGSTSTSSQSRFTPHCAARCKQFHGNMGNTSGKASGGRSICALHCCRAAKLRTTGPTDARV